MKRLNGTIEVPMWGGLTFRQSSYEEVPDADATSASEDIAKDELASCRSGSSGAWCDDGDGRG